MSEGATIEIIGSPRKYIHKYEISDNFNLPNSSLKKHRTIPIVGKYNGYTIETDVINGKMNGKTIVSNGDGKVVEELNLVNDSREGECIERGRDSKLVFQGMYKDDQRNGIGYCYEDGEVDTIIQYEMDVAKMKYKQRSDMDGYWEERDASTNKIIAITQLNNKYEREGHCYVFNNSGSIISANIYSNGNCHMYKSFENDKMTIYDKNGCRVYVGGYRNDMKEDYPCNGKGKCYNVNNGKVKIVYEGDYVNNKWEGEGEYYINGKLRYEGRMKNDYACGEGKYYDEDGVVEASGKWKYGYLNVSENNWLNFESGKYEKGKELCRLKDVKKRDGPYKSGMNVCCEATGDCFSCFIGGIGDCCGSCCSGIGDCCGSCCSGIGDCFSCFIGGICECIYSEGFVIVFFCLYGVYCWVISFFFHHTLLQVLSCISGAICLLSVLSYFCEPDLKDNDFARICIWIGFVWQFVCVLSYYVEIDICQKRGEAFTMWVVNGIISLIAWMVFFFYMFNNVWIVSITICYTHISSQQ